MKSITSLITILFLAFSFSINAQTKNEFEKEHEMKTYYLVFLKQGPDRNQDSVTIAKLQEQHIAHLTKMWNEGKMDMAGPIGEDASIRGVCVYNVGSKEEAQKLANEDPMIKAGRLIAEVHTFYSAKGSTLK